MWTGDCNGKVSSNRPSALNTSVSGLILLLASQHFITLYSIESIEPQTVDSGWQNHPRLVLHISFNKDYLKRNSRREN